MLNQFYKLHFKNGDACYFIGLEILKNKKMKGYCVTKDVLKAPKIKSEAHDPKMIMLMWAKIEKDSLPKDVLEAFHKKLV